MIFALEIHGFGEVGAINEVTDTVRDGAYLRVTLASALSVDDVGRDLYVWGVTGLPTGHYTIADVDGSDVLLATALGGTWSGSAGCALDECYHICDGVPPYVTGVEAADLWLDALESDEEQPAVTTSAGQDVPLLGGIASIDGIEVRLSGYLRDRFAALLYQPVAKVAESIGATVETLVTWGGPLPLDTPIYVGSESIHATSVASSTVDGVTYYTHDVRRGALNTNPTEHLAGEWCIEYVRTPVGLQVSCYTYPDDATSRDDRTRVWTGRVEGWQLDGGGATLRLRMATHVLGVRGFALGKSQAVQWRRGDDSPDDIDWLLWYIEPPRLTRWWPCLEFLGFCLPVPDGDNVWAYGDAVPVPTYADVTRVKLETIDMMERQAAAIEYVWHLGAPDSGGPWAMVDTQYLSRGNWRDSDLSEFASEVTVDEFGQRSLVRVALCPIYPVAADRPQNDVERSGISPMGHVQVHPVEAIRQIVQSSGTGACGDYDTLPVECGCGVPDLGVDTASFDAALAADPTLTAGNVIIRGDEQAKLPELLEMLCRCYGYSLVSDAAGRVRLADMASMSPTAVLTVDDLAEGLIPNYSADYRATLTGFSYQFDRPWLGTVDTLSSRAGADYPVYVDGLATSSVSLKPTFAPYVDNQSQAALAARMGRLAYLNASVSARLTVQVVPTWEGDVGDLARVTLPALPGAEYGATGLDAYGRIIDRQRDIRPIGETWDSVTIAMYGAVVVDDAGLWAPTLLVVSVTSDAVFKCGVGSFGGLVSRLRVGDRVMLYDPLWTARADDPAVVSGVSGTSVTLSAAWKSGGVDVTPAVDDIISLVAHDSCPALSQSEWAWLRPEEEWSR